MIENQNKIYQVMKDSTENKKSKRYEYWTEVVETLVSKYKDLDKTSKNISRVCFVSYDSEIYINKNSKVFEIVNFLKDKGLEVAVFDPFANATEVEATQGVQLITQLETYDAIVITVAHTFFASLDYVKLKAQVHQKNAQCKLDETLSYIEYLNQLKKTSSLEEIFILSKTLQKLPKDSSPIRLRNRCWKTGKPRGYSRFFGLCRNALRELAHDCFLPGVTKASW